MVSGHLEPLDILSQVTMVSCQPKPPNALMKDIL